MQGSILFCIRPLHIAEPVTAWFYARGLGKREGLSMRNKKIQYLTVSAMIAAVYLALTMLFYAISFSPMQSRLAEALTVLPYFTPLAIPGLFVGCLISNILGGNGIWDIIFGSLATLLSAFLTYKLTFGRPRRKWLAPLPPVLINAVVIGAMLSVLYELPLFVTMLEVGVGQIIACYVAGFPLMLLFESSKKIGELFKRFS